LIGILFFVGGIFGGTLWIALAGGPLKLLGIPFLVFFPIIGFLMAFLTLRHRERKARTLRNGTLVVGTVTNVKKTGTVINGQIRFHVGIQFDYEGQQRTATCNAYGTAVDQARALQDSGQETRLLVDPEDATHVVCLDLVMVFD
jgi:hypothetical protein